jgi:hypothetical protein
LAYINIWPFFNPGEYIAESDVINNIWWGFERRMVKKFNHHEVKRNILTTVLEGFINHYYNNLTKYEDWYIIK